MWGLEGGDRNHLSWPVLPIPPGLKSSLLMMRRCERRHLLPLVRTCWLEHLEVPGADEAYVPVLSRKVVDPGLGVCVNGGKAFKPRHLPSRLSQSQAQPLSIFSSILYTLIEDFLTCQALCLLQRINRMNTMYSFSSSPGLVGENVEISNIMMSGKFCVRSIYTVS